MVTMQPPEEEEREDSEGEESGPGSPYNAFYFHVLFLLPFCFSSFLLEAMAGRRWWSTM